MKTDRVVALSRLARARGLIRSEDVRPGQPRWLRKRSAIVSAVESDLLVQSRLNANLATHAKTPFFIGSENAGAALKLAENSQHGVYASLFPWLDLESPEKRRAREQSEFVQASKTLHESLQDESILQRFEEKTGMFSRMRQKEAEAAADQARLAVARKRAEELEERLAERRRDLSGRRTKRG